MIKSNRTKKLLEQHILYFIQVLDQQYMEAVQSKDAMRMRELTEKINFCMLELETLGI